MLKVLGKAVLFVESQPLSFWTWLGTFFSLVFLRSVWEIKSAQNLSLLLAFSEVAHLFLFFLLSFFLFALLLVFFFKVSLDKAAVILLFGFLLILLPPFVDYLVLKEACWRTYEWTPLEKLPQSFISFLTSGGSPIGLTPGVKTEIVLAVFLIFLYGKIKTEQWLRPAIAGLFSSCLFFLLAHLPTFLSAPATFINQLTTGEKIKDLFLLWSSPQKIFSLNFSESQLALNIKMSLMLALAVTAALLLYFALAQRKKFFSFAQNARYPQLFIHWGLVVIGMGLAYFFYQLPITINFFNILAFIVLETAVACAWLASVVANDIYDQKIDELTPNKRRPLITGAFAPSQFASVGWVLFLASLFLGALISLEIALLLLTYQAIAWIYSCPPLRLKRLPFVSSFLSALALLTILAIGFILVAPDQNLKNLPSSIVALLAISFTLSLPIKDFKDIEGDKKEKIYTIPVLFGEQWGKIIIGSGIFISFLLSVVFFQETKLFGWALIFGSACLGIVLLAGSDKKIKYHRLPWWIFGLVFVYGLILVRIVFF